MNARWISPKHRWEAGVDLRQWTVGVTVSSSMVIASVLWFYIVYTRKTLADQLDVWRSGERR